MRQPEDTKTLELLLDQKRGRGRPRVDNPLSPAERARRYREKKRGFRGVGGTRSPADEIELVDSLSSDADSIAKNDSDDVEFWRGMYEAEAERVAELEARIAASRGKRYSYARVTEITENAIREHMASAAAAENNALASQYRGWAYGAYNSWSRLTSGYQADGDYDKLYALIDDY